MRSHGLSRESSPYLEWDCEGTGSKLQRVPRALRFGLQLVVDQMLQTLKSCSVCRAPKRSDLPTAGSQLPSLTWLAPVTLIHPFPSAPSPLLLRSSTVKVNASVTVSFVQSNTRPSWKYVNKAKHRQRLLTKWLLAVNQWDVFRVFFL